MRAAETLLPKCENSCDYNVVARCLAKAMELCIKWQMENAGVRHFPDDDITVLIRRCERCGLPLRLTYVIAYLLQQAIELSLKYQLESKAQYATSNSAELKRIKQALPEVEESVRMCSENCKPFLGKSKVFN